MSVRRYLEHVVVERRVKPILALRQMSSTPLDITSKEVALGNVQLEVILVVL